MKVQVIIAAGGSGIRLQSPVPKPFVLLKGKPLFIYSCEVFERIPGIEGIIVVGHKDLLPRFQEAIEKYQISKCRWVVAGGDTRQKSVRQGLAALAPQTKIVVIHDAARPLVQEEMILAALKESEKEAAVITAVPVKPTIKRVNAADLTVKETVARDDLWEVQTPQVFKVDVLARAHQQARLDQACDDAFLVEQCGVRVKVVHGDYRNIKVTTQDDLVLAEKLLEIKIPVGREKEGRR